MTKFCKFEEFRDRLCQEFTCDTCELYRQVINNHKMNGNCFKCCKEGCCVSK